MGNRFIGIVHDESSDVSAYGGVTVSEIGGDIQTFNTGDVVADWKSMTAWVSANPIAGRYMYSSSVDHFVMDVPGYAWDQTQEGIDIIVADPAPAAEPSAP